jgi:hypothetical protein
MKAPVRFAAAALGALLALAGCTTTTTETKTVQAVQIQPVYQMEVVEKSKDLEVTPELLAELRESTTKYLKDQGYNREGEYILKVNLTPDLPEATGQWVVLRINSQPAQSITLLAAYPGADDFYPYDFYGYYNYGYAGYPPYYYYDPFGFGYGYGGGYYPPVPPWHHQPGGKGDRPPGTHTGWDSNRPPSGQPYPGGGGSGRPNNSNSRPPSSHQGGGGSRPPSAGAPSQPPPPPPPPARAEQPPQVRQDRYTPPTEEK